jgi:hypothetical protein
MGATDAVLRWTPCSASAALVSALIAASMASARAALSAAAASAFAFFVSSDFFDASSAAASAVSNAAAICASGPAPSAGNASLPSPSRDSRSNTAVRFTKGLAMYADASAVPALFHSNAGTGVAPLIGRSFAASTSAACLFRMVSTDCACFEACCARCAAAACTCAS